MGKYQLQIYEYVQQKIDIYIHKPTHIPSFLLTWHYNRAVSFAHFQQSQPKEYCWNEEKQANRELFRKML